MFGPVGTLFIATLGFVSAVSWLMAVAGVVVRPWKPLLKWSTVVIMSLFPPLSLFVLAWIHMKEQQYRRVRREAAGT